MFKRFRRKSTWELEKESEMWESERYAIEKGFTHGYESGIEKGFEQIAKQMLNKNIDVNIIIECTGLTQEELTKLNKH